MTNGLRMWPTNTQPRLLNEDLTQQVTLISGVEREGSVNIERDLSSGKFLVYRESNERRSYFALWVDADKSSWTYLRNSACMFLNQEKAEDVIAEVKRRSKMRRAAKNKDLGNTQCGVCLNIFPVKGALPQDVNCPRCGTAMLLEWREQPSTRG